VPSQTDVQSVSPALAAYTETKLSGEVWAAIGQKAGRIRVVAMTKDVIFASCLTCSFKERPR
jgi:hypothetical protein